MSQLKIVEALNQALDQKMAEKEKILLQKVLGKLQIQVIIFSMESQETINFFGLFDLICQLWKLGFFFLGGKGRKYKSGQKKSGSDDLD